MNDAVVRDFMTTLMVTLRQDMGIYEAIKILLKNKTSGAWVLDESKMLLGVLSEKDCLRIFANKAFNQIPTGLVADYMSKSMKSLHPDDDLFKVTELFLKNPFRRLPVIEHGILIGQVSRYDVLLEGSRRLG